MGELGGMKKPCSHWQRTKTVAAAALVAAGLVVAIPPRGVEAAGSRETVAAREARARRAGLRVLSGTHLVLVTDRPTRPGDGVEELPAVFDQAFDAWCEHYGMNPESHADWQSFGCLIVDRERFRAAGLLPDTIPPFVNGFCERDHFWLMDQSNPAYRRHLLLHEGVHAFTLTLRGLATPVWYNEGIAEYLATHRLERAAAGKTQFVATPIPEVPDDVEQLGRIEKIRELREAGRVPSLEETLGLTVNEHGSIGDYATSWASVAMMANHPAYAEAFAILERGPLEADFNRQLTSMPGWDAPRAARDFDAFTADLDYGWDFSRMAIDWSTGTSLETPRTLAVEGDRGWQNSGIALTAGRRYAMVARGRVGVGSITDESSGLVTKLESEPGGISLQWYRGRPVGQLLAAQWAVPAGDGRPRFQLVAKGEAAEITAVVDGPLFFKINQFPGRLPASKGMFSVEVRQLR